MRKWYVPLGLLLGGVLWSATSGAAAQPTFGPANLSRGERVTLRYKGLNSMQSSNIRSGLRVGLCITGTSCRDNAANTSSFRRC